MSKDKRFLQLIYYSLHQSCWLFLLLRIIGDAPTSEKWRRRFGLFESGLILTMEAALLRASEPGAFCCYRSCRSHFNSKLLLILPIEEEVHKLCL